MKKLQEVAELLFSAYSRQSELTIEQRVKILKNLVAELFITNKKELQIEESPIFQSSKMLNLFFGTTKGFQVGTFRKLMNKVKLDDLIEFRNMLKLVG